MVGAPIVVSSSADWRATTTEEGHVADVSKFVDKAFEGQDFSALAKAPVSALQGVSDADAVALKQSLGIVSIADLATNKFVLWAQAITTLSK